MRRRAPKQLSFPQPRTWGGRRRGAGRKPNAARPGPTHARRPSHDHRHPVHVTLRARNGIPSFRSDRTYAALQRALTAANRAPFRIVHFSVQSDHIHLIVEADERLALIRGVHGLAVRSARAINRSVGRRGQVWPQRYHARALPTPSETRRGLVYVLLNFRKHLRAAPAVDPRSSGAWFDGWAQPAAQPPTVAATAPPVRPGRTWLVTIGWRRAGGAIDVREHPAANSANSRSPSRARAHNKGACSDNSRSSGSRPQSR
jgi:REP element-mobilizing transposase RayT